MPHVTGPVLSPAVAAAIRAGAPVVALESTLLAHGLPAPRNREVADELESAVRDRGAVPATVAVLDGVPRVGLTPAELDRVCGGGRLVKLSVRDLGVAVGLRPRRRDDRGRDRGARGDAPGSRCSPPEGSAGCTAGRAETLGRLRRPRGAGPHARC